MADIVGAAFHTARLVAGRFGVVTTLSRSIPATPCIIWRPWAGEPLRLCARVGRARLALEHPVSDADARIAAEVGHAKDQDRAETIVLGCPGMADLAARLTAAHGLPVLDGVARIVEIAEGPVALGLKTSKQGGLSLTPDENVKSVSTERRYACTLLSSGPDAR